MASNAKSSTANQQATRVQQYVDTQLEKTRRQVKTYELIVACLMWAVAVAAFFLLMSLIDAWVVSLSTTFRWLALATLIGGTLLWIAASVVPLFLRKINLDYAAQMIEQATPNVKNRVLNYTLLRKRNDSVNAAVMDAVSRQAAEKLHSIPGDTTIDRSQLIRVGFILVGLMVFAVTYKLVSPRDPLQTVRRILFPGQLLSKPASVQIGKVTPGNCRVFFGDALQVTATVKGPHVPEDVRLMITSDDGQITNMAIPMMPDESGHEYQGLISPDDTGIQQSLRYRIEARDGVTPDYRVTVKANPSVAIERIELTPPAYTRLPKQTLDGRGDIEAIEGTEAMIFAVANLPIEVAYIELLNAVPDDDPQNPNATRMKPAAPPIEMRLLPDNRASGRFNVTLNSSRTRPTATHYQIRFVSIDDERNETPNVYPIRVTPDLAPEVKIVEPRSRQTNVAANGRLTIRVEANDLDFAIDSVVLNMDHQGSQLVRQSLDLESENDNQRVNCQFLFVPSRYRLQAGDQVLLHAVASDNRISIKSLAADPNISQTDNYTINITEVDPDADPEQQPQDQQPPDDRNEPSDDNDNSDPDSQSDQPDDENQPMDDPSDEGTQDDNTADQQDPSDGDETGEEGQEQNGDSESGNEEGAEGSEANGQSENDSEQAQPENDQGSGQEENGGSADENQENAGGRGQNESRNDGVTDEGDPQGSSDGGGNQGGGGEGSESGGNDDPSDANSGGSPDNSGEQGPAGTNQDDPNAQASDSANDGPAADGSPTNGGARSENSDSNTDQQGTRDQNLKDGQRERLPKDAHDGEKFEKLDELLKDQQPSEPSPDKTGDQQGSSDQEQNDQKQDGQSGQGDQPENGNPSEQGNQPNGDSPGEKSPGQKSEGQQGSPSDPQSSQSEGQQDSSGSEGQESEGAQGSESAGGEPQESGSSGGDQGNPSDGQGQSSEGSQKPGGSGGEGGQGGADPSSSDAQGSSDAQSGTGKKSGQQPSNKSADATANGQSGEPGEPGEGAQASDDQGSGAGSDQTNNEQLEKEKADLEHAKRATDLVLNKLEDQQYDPDPDLLEKMNWTEQDLRDFLDRWKRMKQNAQTGDPNAQQQYEEAIKSLGLRPDANSRTAKNRDADASGLNQDSSVIEPPADLAPDFNEFLRDRNRVR